jgi:Dullard-like phosphatase family protein
MSIKKFEQYSQKPLLVLDLDNTLITAVHKAYLTGVYEYPSDFMVSDDNLHVNVRPHLSEFMNYAFNNWRVALWTAASEGYAREILKKCGIDANKLEFLKFKEDCDKEFYYGDTIHIKDLSKISEDLSRVVLVDDKETSGIRQKDNTIVIPAYISAAQTADDRLLKLIYFLEEMKNAPDFRSVNKVDWYK